MTRTRAERAPEIRGWLVPSKPALAAIGIVINRMIADRTRESCKAVKVWDTQRADRCGHKPKLV